MQPGKLELIAQFKLDKAGKPVFQSSKSGLKHFEITLKADASRDTQSVVYRLDPSYFDPVREVVKRSDTEEFAEDITSYGDYKIELAASGSQFSTPSTNSVWLSDALRRGHHAALNDPAILEAIETISRG